MRNVFAIFIHLLVAAAVGLAVGPPSLSDADPSEPPPTALTTAPATAPPVTPTGRVLHRFDFEERDDGNFEDLPMHWSKVTGPGMPHYVRGALATDAVYAGRFSFRLDLNGGSVLYRLTPGRLPVEAGAHYRVQGRVRTTPLKFAKARVTAYFADAAGQLVAGSVRHSDPYAATADVADEFQEADAGDWVLLDLELPPAGPEGVSLVVELGLLQPAQMGAEGQTRSDAEADARLDLARFQQDVRGAAWFDDVVVSRVPSVALLGPAAGNVFAREAAVAFAAVITDHATDDLSAAVGVRDAAGRAVRRVRGRFERGGQGEPTLVHFDIGPLGPGWYEGTFVVSGAGAPRDDGDARDGATVQKMGFVVLPDADAPGATDGRVVVDATSLPAGEWADLPEVLPTLAAGRVKLGVWTRAHQMDAAGSAAFDALISKLAAGGVRTTGVFVDPPADVAEATGATDWRALASVLTAASPTAAESGAVEFWNSGLSYLVSRHAHQIDRWQVGADSQADAFASDPALRAVYRAFETAITELMARPDVAMPWPAQTGLESADGELPGTLTLRVGPATTPRQIPLYVDEILRHPNAVGRELSLSLEVLDAATYGRLESLSDLARRLTYSLASGVRHVTVPLPFTPIDAGDAYDAVEINGLRRRQQPAEAYLVVRTLLRHLAGCAYAGRVPAGEGLEAFLFVRESEAGGEATGVLVLWDGRARLDDAAGAQAELMLNLTPGAAQFDAWGNAVPLEQSAEDRLHGRARLRVGAMPGVVVGVDAALTRLRATLALDRPTVESTFETHVRRVGFQNTFARAISGRLELRPPEGWELRFADGGDGGFALNPGERFDRAVELRFPYNSYAGAKAIDADLIVRVAGTEGGRDGPRERRLRVPLTVRLGLEDVGLRTTAHREGAEVVVEQTITNYGLRPLNYTAFVLFPDQPRQERLVTNLGQDQSVVRAYRFPAPMVIGAPLTIRSGLRELEGTRILNDKVELR